VVKEIENTKETLAGKKSDIRSKPESARMILKVVESRLEI
jgi:hypothetical protein